MIEALVFDLDDTLYRERDFVMSGYRAVARFLSDSGICDFDNAFLCMEKAFDAWGRQMVFSSLLELIPNTAVPLADLINVYRQHVPTIHLFPGYRELLEKLNRQYRLGIITDGLPSVQGRKVRALGLEPIMDKIIYTWEYGEDKEKPHPYSFSLMLESLHVSPNSALFIGDNPDKDCLGAHGIGMKFVQVGQSGRRGKQFSATERQMPEYLMDTLFELPQILQHIN